MCLHRLQKTRNASFWLDPSFDPIILDLNGRAKSSYEADGIYDPSRRSLRDGVGCGTRARVGTDFRKYPFMTMCALSVTAVYAIGVALAISTATDRQKVDVFSTKQKL